MPRIRSLSWPLIPALVLSLAPAPAGAQLCLNNSIYFDLSDEAASFPICHDGVLTCQEPELQVVDVALDPPDCDQTFQSCAVTATVDTKFPGNHQNDPSLVGFGYSFATLLLETEGGGFVDACGFPGAAIRRDVGRFIHSVGVPCPLAKEDPETFKLKLTATMCPCPPGVPFCPWQAACEKKAEEMIDFVLPSLECPPKNECCDECGECLEVGSGGMDKAGSVAGICSAETGPGARLRYIAGGVGTEYLPGTPAWAPVLGRGWSHDYAERLVRDPDDRRVWLLTRFGSFREFRDSGGDGFYEYVSPSDEERELRRTASGWQLTDPGGTVQSFDGAGRWQSTLDRNGVGKTASYGVGGLTQVNMPDGRQERFTYYPGGKLATIVEVGVDGTSTHTWSYLWAGDDLVEILRPDSSRWRYRYQDPRHPGYMTQSILVGTDGSERVETAWQYDHAGRAVRIWKGDVASGATGPVPGPAAIEVSSVTFTEKDDVGLVTESRVTDPLGQVSTYTFGRDSVSAKPRLTSLTGDCPTCSLGPNSQLFYDDPAHPMRPTRVIDARGTVTLMSYNAQGQMISRTEALGTELERTTTWEYHPAYPDLVTAIERPSTSGSGVHRTTLTRDGDGNPTLRTEEGVESGSAFSYETVTTYNSAGRPLSTNPPGFGTQDQRIFSYDPNRGNLILETRTDPLIGVTSFGYDPFNRRTSVTDVNGVTTETFYDELDRVTRVVQKGAMPSQDLVTTLTYTPLGQPHRIALPEGNAVEYGYDSSGRLISFERKPDPATHGERSFYTLNSAGQRIREQHQSWDGSGWQTESFTDFVYGSRCKLDKIVHPDGSVTEFTYDCAGNLSQEWDANHPSNNQQNPPSKTFAYDPLNRLETITQRWGGAGGGSVVTRYGYDVMNRVNEVVDGNATVTRYTYSDRGLLTEQASEISGATRRAYNEHGQLVLKTDGRGVPANRTWDALDRLVAVDFPGDELDVLYTYDDPTVAFSKGRNTAITRDGESIDFRYDLFGRLVQDGPLTFSYDRNGNRRSIGYPGGVSAFYSHDFADRQASLSIQVPAQAAQILVSAASYQPSGPLTSLTLGNGLIETRLFDQLYRPASIEIPGLLSWTYTNDAVGNVLGISDNLQPGSSRSYDYQDYQYFLTRGDGPWGTLSWSYDKHGNRLTETRNGNLATYDYLLNAANKNSPQLASTLEDGPPGTPTVFAYDENGNLTHESRGGSKVRHIYDAASRLSQILRDTDKPEASVTTLRYDGRGFLSKSELASSLAAGAPALETRPTYSSEGLLYHRSTTRRALPSSSRGAPATAGEDYIFYFAGRPQAQLELMTSTPPNGPPSSSRTLKYLTSDHLGTPALITDESGGVIDGGTLEPFGAGGDDAGGGSFLRLPGQWADETFESSGLYYNVNRWYRPALGSYTRPDPFGLHLGLEPYIYAQARPLFLVDIFGLQSGIPVISGPDRDPFVPPIDPEFGTGPWGERPDEECCDPDELKDAVKGTQRQIDRMNRGQAPEGTIGAAVITEASCDPDTGWCYPFAPTDPSQFDPQIVTPIDDPCVLFCTRVHEWMHFIDNRRYNFRWSQQQLGRTTELITYPVELACLKSFL